MNPLLIGERISSTGRRTILSIRRHPPSSRTSYGDAHAGEKGETRERPPADVKLQAPRPAGQEDDSSR